jgi:hypothetical protein
MQITCKTHGKVQARIDRDYKAWCPECVAGPPIAMQLDSEYPVGVWASAAVIRDLRQEVGRARAKLPANKHLLAALMEEVGELAEALLKAEPKARIQAEALQVACVAIRIFEEGDSSFENWEGEKE